jgi:cellulose synthase/poly-beta-1,6-N-acetylglucosamine synthase-like glycosyltransferase
MVLVFFLVYGSALLFIFGYSMAQAHLVYRYLRGRTKRIAAQQRLPALADYPPVTVQLPVYNERYVIERLLDSVAALDYPADKLQIQVLDDSTDETVALIARKVAQLRAGGINITQIRRSVRTGYKAGALQDALPAATGEFIAIFDADFVPPADFLKQHYPTLPIRRSVWYKPAGST